ncbi:hypothetical protein VN24_24360 [Paenibacillus beijingensis]|uniref:Uncharacterized protein n=2 Tax=Paenibacillus beijingensis TaxID=1126833 RepID=A0A0D5NS57_9BACL|nr:hypothetical protein VN24_24360 [Paenibacillus beijingensis]
MEFIDLENAYKEAVIRKLIEYDVIKDPQWLEQPDAPVPLRVFLETIIELIEKLDPQDWPYD